MEHRPPRVPVWLGWDQSVFYFVTICVADRKPVLANEEAYDAFILAVSKLQHWHVLAAILMPDHFHALVAPQKEREAKLGNFSGALKRWNAPGTKSLLEMAARLLRSGDSLHEKWLYVRENPVRSGLVQRWEDWPYRYEFNEGIGKRSACPTSP